MYQVTREIHFSYAHRLLDYQGKCAYLHGHNGRVLIEVSAEKLDKQNMVIDFHEIKKVMEKWIDETLDHKTILWEKDALVPLLEKAGQRLVLLKENPTAEALAHWIFSEAKKKDLAVSRVTLWETHDSCASYNL